MTISEYIREKIFNGNNLVQISENDKDKDRKTFINNDEEILKNRLDEYHVWYYGDSDELLNFYTEQNTIEMNYEPFYSRNKKNYFWAISSTESDIKRTHSGQPRNIVDTLVGICRFPTIKAISLGEDKNDAVNKTLYNIIKEGNIADLYSQQQLPLTLVEGWGCYKINWDLSISDYPYAVYYSAQNVDFIWKANRAVGVIFKDYYTNKKGTRFLRCETRSIKYDEKKKNRYLLIQYDVFQEMGENSYIPINKESVPEIGKVDDYVVDNFDKLLAVPCILYKNTGKTLGIGRSIFTGKIDLFDDLDQALSQGANSVRKSTPIEYVNSEFFERDKNGLPIQPHAYDRKFSVYQGAKSADGETLGSPVQITQPQINFAAYSDNAIAILLQILNGIMSPATLGIDVAKKDNAEAQREKEKSTIFTRNGIISKEEKILKELLSQMLCAKELIDKNEITVKNYDISIKFSEFADDSYENKLKILGEALDDENISVEMYLDKLYGNTLSDEEYNREKDFLINHKLALREQSLSQGMNQENMMASALGQAPGAKEEI